MTDVPKRIWATPYVWIAEKCVAGDIKYKGVSRDDCTEYVRADIADEMLEALKEIERIYYLEGKNAIYRAAHMRGVAERMIGAVEDKAEGDDT